MTIYTPGSMPISFPMKYAFTLLDRLYPTYRPHKVLKIADGMDCAPEAIAFILAALLFLFKINFAIIFISVLVFPSLIKILHIRSNYNNFTVYSGVIFSYIGKLGLLTSLLTVLGWFSVGWQGLLAFFIARFIGGLVNTFLEAREKRKIRDASGIVINEFDRCFIDAYRFCANKIGLTLDYSISEEELESDRWQIIYLDYSTQDPLLFQARNFS
ncbi:hypothetical protein [Allocoleopsis sp.]|uniref:hypothetical protein n=1 Tax=Allocoleopsis sp. TaxID=3088169 RepID=UPI002FD468E1